MLTPDEIERYKRQLVLKEIGGEGQQRLKDAKVLVVGAGGLGSPLLIYLAAAGMGRSALSTTIASASTISSGRSSTTRQAPAPTRREARQRASSA